jgi:anti-sigma B factor antagonist
MPQEVPPQTVNKKSQETDNDIMSTNQDLPIQIDAITDGVVIRPSGDIDLSRAPSLRTQIAEVFKTTPMRMIVDLSDVPYMDSSGVATLVEGMQIASRSGTKFILLGLQDRVRSIFEIARLDTVFTITLDMEAAERF